MLGRSDGVKRSRVAIVALAILATVMTACGNTPSAGQNDFKIVAYQGDSILGGHESSFAKVFEQGKPVVLNFWAGLCPPCRAEMPGFEKVSQEFQDKVIFVGIDVGPYVQLGSHDDATRLYKQLGIHYPLAYAVDATPLRLYQVAGMPTTVFLTAKGRLVQKQTGLIGDSDLRNAVKKLLAEVA